MVRLDTKLKRVDVPAIVEIVPANKSPKLDETIVERTAHRTPLTDRWKTARAPHVTTAELPEAIAEIFLYSKSIGLFDLSAKDITHVAGQGDEGRLDVMYVPNRRPAMRDQKYQLAPGACVLLDPPNPEQRGLSWRNYIVWPNIFPYFSTDIEHTVIAAASPQDQTFSTAVLRDMFDWQAAAKEPVTMLYNGMAGNSERQLHWHAMKWRLPVEQRIDDKSLALTTKKESASGRVATFEDGFYGGLFVEGSREFVGRETVKLIDNLERRPPTSGKYNVLMLTPKNDRVRLVIIPRAAGIESREHGAITMSGMLLVQAPPPVDIEEFEAHARGQLVLPSELPWLNDVLDRPQHPRFTALAS